MTTRRGGITRSDGFLYAALGLAIAMPLRVPGLRGVLAGGLVNPESYTRLARLKETLRQGSPAHETLRDVADLGGGAQ